MKTPARIFLLDLYKGRTTFEELSAWITPEDDEQVQMCEELETEGLLRPHSETMDGNYELTEEGMQYVINRAAAAS